MDYILIIYFSVLFVLLILSSIFSMLEMTFSNVKTARLKGISKSTKKDELVKNAVTNFDDTIATILFSNDFVNIFASSLTTIIAITLFPETSNQELVTLIASIILVFTMLVFCEILPKAIAKNHSYKIAYAFVYFFYFFKYLLFVIIKLVNSMLTLITSTLFERTGEEDKVASDEELEEMVDEIEEEGIIDNDQSDLIHNSISFKETSCYEVMTPRVKMFGYNIETPIKLFLQNADCFKYSRIIVYKKDKDNVLGYIPTKTLLRSLINNKKIDVPSLLIPLDSVFRTVPISTAMQIMKKSRNHILLVRDEYGGTEGIITMEDILEELVGEIYDEKDKESEELIKINIDNVYVAKGSLNITDLYNEFNIDDKELSDEYSTLSGFVTHNLCRYAHVGDNFIHDNLYFEVLSVKSYIVDFVLIYKLDIDEDDDEPILDDKLKKKIEEIKYKTIKKHNKHIQILNRVND